MLLDYLKRQCSMKIITRYEAARAIDRLYKRILGRPVDKDGLRHHLERFSHLGMTKGILATTEILMGSEEFNVNYRTRKRIAFPAGTRQINGKSVKHIISLGNHCLAATLLKKYGVKQYSTPFDWIFTTPAMVVECLEDNFATFLNPDYHRSITHNRCNKDNEPGASHLLYAERYGLSEIFTHRDVTKEADRQYLCRTVDRFNRVVGNDEGKIFLMICRPKWKLEDSFIKLVEQLSQRTPHFAFYAIQLKPPVQAEQNPSAHLALIKQVGSSYLYEFTPSFNEGNTGRFDNTLDEGIIASLLAQYDITI